MIRLVVALQVEARPLIDRFRLSADSRARGFRVYRGVDCALVVSGVGQVAAASATAYLEAFLDEAADCPWVNVGVAGHANLPLGSAALAHKVAVEDGSQYWYPGLVVDWPGLTAELRTLSSPGRCYEGECLFDMEAAAFYPTACRFASSELVHCLKIVSDNAGAPAEQVTRERVVALVSGAIPEIETLLAGLRELAGRARVMHRPPAGFDEALRRWHFSASERHRLRRAMQRYETLAGAPPRWPGSLARVGGSEVLSWLEGALDETPPSLLRCRQ